MAESGEAEGSRKLKPPEKEDRLSALPDSLIQHILSFLPSTKEAIQTGILSKRWLNQWTLVPNLFFDFYDMFSDHYPQSIPLSSSAISRILDQTLSLHRCSKVQKFHIITDKVYEHEHDPNYEDKIRFVVTKQPEELVLHFSDLIEFALPDFFFCQPSLVKLQLFGCSITHIGVLNWKSLKDLSIECCYCSDEVIRSIVSGSPLLQSLEVNYCLDGLSRLVIASKSLKTLAVINLDCYVDILCPNLYACILFSGRQNFGWCDRVLNKFLSDTPSLESLKLKYFEFSNIQITSKTLKKLAFGGQISHEIAISCPNLEELGLSGCLKTIRLMNLSSSVCASLDLYYRDGSKETSVQQILESVQHLNELELKSYFIETLSTLEMDGKSHTLLNNKSLTLKSSRQDSIFAHIPGIVFALRSSPVLERLVVKLQKQTLCGGLQDLSTMDRVGENYWNSNGNHLSGLISRLRTVKITGFSRRDKDPKLVLDFIAVILKNATVLEKMVVILEDCGADFVIKVSEKLLSFPRCSAAVVELICP